MVGRHSAGTLHIVPTCHESREKGIALDSAVVSLGLTTVGGTAHMPQLAEEDTSSLTHSLCDWFPCLYLLWCVDSWDVRIPMALLQSIMPGW